MIEENSNPARTLKGWYQTASGNWYNKKVCLGMSVHILAECEECGCIFFARKYKSKGPKGGIGHLWCSKSCTSKATIKRQDLSHLRPHDFKKGQKPHNCKGRGKHGGGYVQISRNGENLLEHRLIMEAHLGRKLDRTEIVHHINNNPMDNRIENLIVMSQREHVKIHWANGSFKDREEKKKMNIINQWVSSAQNAD